MNGKPAAVLLSGLLVACVQTQLPETAAPPAASPPPVQAQTPAPAQTPVAQTPAAETAAVDRIVNIRRASCEDLLKLSPEDRAAASMFYIGYQASRFRARTINVGLISSIEGQAIADCESNPDRTVAQAFADAYLQNRRR